MDTFKFSKILPGGEERTCLSEKSDLEESCHFIKVYQSHLPLPPSSCPSDCGSCLHSLPSQQGSSDTSSQWLSCHYGCHFYVTVSVTELSVVEQGHRLSEKKKNSVVF